MVFWNTQNVPLTILGRALRWVQLDRAIAFAVLGNIASLVLGPVTALLIATHFSPELQGYYYTFGSLAMLQFLLDLGLGQAIIQFASHEWAKLSFATDGRIVGIPDSLSRLISLGQLSLRWYCLSAVLVILGIGLLGCYFFSFSPTPGIQWMWPWFALCLGLGFNFVFMPVFYLLQGCNQVSQFWFYRFIQQIGYGLSLWLAILLGAKLWTTPIATASGLVWSGLFLWQRYPNFVATFLSSPRGPLIDWRTEVWPVQWRIAISWLSSNFITFLFAPVLFQLSGPVTAGQMGITVTLNSVLLAIASNWVVTKGPRFGVLVAQQKYSELDRLFLKSFLISLIVVCCGAGVFWVLVYVLHMSKHPFGSRVLPPLPTGLFLAATIFNLVNTNLSIYLRAHKKEPLAGIFFVASVLIVTFIIFFGIEFGAVGVTAGYLAVVAFFQVPVSLFIFWRRRAKWHNELMPLSSGAVERIEGSR